ncbi:hypothetical protein [Rhizobium rhizogenes]|uniref:hypothetical protein n=1 Tax=Rhizobium rhizogenes TaxID=359 RepID=UPI0015747B2B|nr:hypothetical protein [Rhizobium rhizogenes]NTI27131.1 hypothetical protein [Rhizobium rhizogenes]
MEVMEIDLDNGFELKTERFVFMLEKSTVDAVDDWGFSNRLRSRAEALRQLVHKGLAASEAETKNADATT